MEKIIELEVERIGAGDAIDVGVGVLSGETEKSLVFRIRNKTYAMPILAASQFKELIDAMISYCENEKKRTFSQGLN